MSVKPARTARTTRTARTARRALCPRDDFVAPTVLEEAFDGCGDCSEIGAGL